MTTEHTHIKMYSDVHTYIPTDMPMNADMYLEIFFKFCTRTCSLLRYPLRAAEAAATETKPGQFYAVLTTP